MTTPTPTRTGEPRLAAIASWAVLAASFGLSAATWIALAQLAGFTDTLHLPVLDVTVGLAWLMPIAVDGYVVVALVLWMAPVPARVAHFAKVNTYAAAAIGVAAQSAYHALTVWSAQPADHREAWRAVLAAIVGALPPAVAGLAVHMRALIRRESQTIHPPAALVEQPSPPTVAPVEQPAPTVEQPAPTVEQPAAAAVPMAQQPAVGVEPSGSGRDGVLVPIAPAAFTRVNGTHPAGVAR